MLTSVNGQPVHVAVAAAFQRLNTAFRNATGKSLIISSGYRSHAEQTKFFLERYVQRNSGNGPYGDVRWWQGRRYVRISGAGTVAVPGTSLHESYRAIDIRDTGSDPGVTAKNTVRSNWIRNNAHRYGFNPNGFSFGEPWHIEFTGALTIPAGGGTTPLPIPTPIEPKENEMEFGYFSRTTGTPNGKPQWAITHPLYFPDGVFITQDLALANGFSPYTGRSQLLNEAGRWDGMLKTAKLVYDAAWAAEAKRAGMAATTEIGNVTVDIDYDALAKAFATALLDEQSKRLAE